MERKEETILFCILQDIFFDSLIFFDKKEFCERKKKERALCLNRDSDPPIRVSIKPICIHGYVET